MSKITIEMKWALSFDVFSADENLNQIEINMFSAHAIQKT